MYYSKFIISILFCFFTVSVMAQDNGSLPISNSCKDCCKDCYGKLCIHNKCKDCCKDCFGQYPVPDSCKDCYQDFVPANNCKDCGDVVCVPGECKDCFGGVNGKVDLAPAYVHVDILESGKTVHHMDLFAFKGDCYYRFWSGFVIKPSLLVGKGHHHDFVSSSSIGLGFCMPFKECICVTPVAGYTWGYLKTQFHREHDLGLGPDLKPIIIHLSTRETFKSRGPFIGFEASWKFCPRWRIVTYFQYIWSNTKTDLDVEGTELRLKSSSKGPSYSAMIEHDLNDCWSINFGAAYNISLSKEKHGLRAAGCKLGIAYWF